MPSGAASRPDAEDSQGQVHLVVEDEELLRGDGEAGGQVGNGWAALVHEASGTRQDDLPSLDRPQAQEGVRIVPFERYAPARRHLLQHARAGVVASPCVVSPRVSQSHDHQVHCHQTRPGYRAATVAGLSRI